MKERPILFSAPMVRALLAGTKTQTRRIVKDPKAVARVAFASDMPCAKPISTIAGERYPAKIADRGAVSVDTGEGWLGAKPGEFDFACPYADGRTYLDQTPGRSTWRVDVEAGSRLWVKETWQAIHADVDPETGYADDVIAARSIPTQNDVDAAPSYWGVDYAADHSDDETREDRGFPWRPSIFMPRWASRIDLEVTGVRVERLHDISEADAVAEGISRTCEDHGCSRQCGCASCIEGGCERATDAYAALWCEINGAESWSANPWVWVVGFKRICP